MYTESQRLSNTDISEREAMGTRILVVDDERMVTEVVERYLAREGYEVRLAAEGNEALSIAHEWSPDLIVLDLMLPGVDGLEVCRRLRANAHLPIIMLTARGEESDRIVGLEMGADDYIVKPFSPRELVARIKAVLRRTSTSPVHTSGGSLRFEAVAINPRSRVVTVDGHEVRLTAKEFDLLLFLASNAGQVFTREPLMDKVWDFTYAGDASTVTVHIRRVREKIEADPLKPRHIKTVWGVGYKFEA